MRLKLLLRYPVDIRRAQRMLVGRSDPSLQFPQRPLVLDLRTPQLMFDCGRHFYSIAHYAAQVGSPTYVRCSRLLLGGISRKPFGGDMLRQPHVSWLGPDEPLPTDSLILGDYDPSERESAAFGPDATYMGMMIGRDIDRSLPVMPYPMHPATLKNMDRCDIDRLRSGDASRRAILFAGSQKARYGDSWMQREFGVLSRLEILDALRERHADRVVPKLEPQGDPKRIVIVDSRLQAIAAPDWLPALASARFFLCCPGGRQPLCHNLIEAMSVGTIPVIEYGDRITPMLRDNENAICFRGKAGLLEAVERIDQMSVDQLEGISRGVAEFYDRHLCGSKFIRQLREGEITADAGRLCMPFNEKNFYVRGRSIAA